MDIFDLILKYLFLGCLFVAPLVVLLATPTMPAWIKAARLWVPILLFSFAIFCTALEECFIYFSLDCLIFKSLLCTVATLFYIMYIGWFEYVWRRFYKCLAWPPQKNLSDSFTSACVLCISRIMMWSVFIVIIIITVLKYFRPLLTINF